MRQAPFSRRARPLLIGVPLATSLLLMQPTLSHLAQARTVRPLFEPTDLEMEETGDMEIDLQFGEIRSGTGAWRLVIPDFEIDIGIASKIEVDLDGAYAIEGSEAAPLGLEHPAPDTFWPSVKIGLADRPSAKPGGFAYAMGGQVGPKLPVAAAAHGVGVESLLLFGMAYGRWHTVLNVGGFADPAPDAISKRPKGIEAGIDVARDLGSTNRYSLTGELSGVRFVSDDPPQLLATAGATWSANSFLDLSLVGLVGFLNGSDRYGLLLGVSPKLHL